MTNKEWIATLPKEIWWDIVHFYREHPAEFVEKCFGVKLTPYQKMALTKTASQSQTGITCWNRTNQKYAYALFEIIRASTIS